MSVSINLSGKRLVLTGLVAGVLLALPLAVLAVDSFTDVPFGNSYYNDVEALKAKGVTTGCAPNLYCPKDYVTREQMAAFMNRLGALSAGKTPVVNADKVDGYDAGSLVRSAATGTGQALALTDTEATYLTLTVTAPVAGYVIVNGTWSVEQVNCTEGCDAYSRIEWVEGAMFSHWVDEGVWHDSAVEPDRAGIANTARFEVGPGVVTIHLLAARETGDGTISADSGDLTALFVPFDSTGVAP